MQATQETPRRLLQPPSPAAVLLAQREVERTRLGVERDLRLLRVELLTWGYAQTFAHETGSVSVTGQAFTPVRQN